ARDRRPGRQLRWTHLAPVPAGVRRHIDQTVVGTHPYDVVRERRDGDRGNGVEHLLTGHVGADWAARPRLFALVVASEVRADGLPVDALIRRLQEDIRSHQQLAGIAG